MWQGWRGVQWEDGRAAFCVLRLQRQWVAECEPVSTCACGARVEEVALELAAMEGQVGGAASGSCVLKAFGKMPQETLGKAGHGCWKPISGPPEDVK